MSSLKCCVDNCATKKGYGLPLHYFPNPTKYLELFKTWIIQIGGEIVGLENNYIYKNRRVCSKHFEEKYFINKWKVRSNCAVPTLFLRGDVTHKRPVLKQISNPILPQTDQPSTSKVSTFDASTSAAVVDNGVTTSTNVIPKRRPLLQELSLNQVLPQTDEPKLTTMGPQVGNLSSLDALSQVGDNQILLASENQPSGFCYQQIKEELSHADSTQSNRKSPANVPVDVNKYNAPKLTNQPTEPQVGNNQILLSSENQPSGFRYQQIKEGLDDADSTESNRKLPANVSIDVNKHNAPQLAAQPTEPQGNENTSQPQNKLYEVTPFIEVLHADLRKARRELTILKQKHTALIKRLSANPLTAHLTREKRGVAPKPNYRLGKKTHPEARQFLMRQIELTKHGRRFTAEDKAFARQIYKTSPACYALLRKKLIMPSISTLIKKVQCTEEIVQSASNDHEDGDNLEVAEEIEMTEEKENYLMPPVSTVTNVVNIMEKEYKNKRTLKMPHCEENRTEGEATGMKHSKTTKTSIIQKENCIRDTVSTSSRQNSGKNNINLYEGTHQMANVEHIEMTSSTDEEECVVLPSVSAGPQTAPRPAASERDGGGVVITTSERIHVAGLGRPPESTADQRIIVVQQPSGSGLTINNEFFIIEQ